LALFSVVHQPLVIFGGCLDVMEQLLPYSMKE
jgi:hypothetical protein